MARDLVSGAYVVFCSYNLFSGSLMHVIII